MIEINKVHEGWRWPCIVLLAGGCSGQLSLGDNGQLNQGTDVANGTGGAVATGSSQSGGATFISSSPVVGGAATTGGTTAGEDSNGGTSSAPIDAGDAAAAVQTGKKGLTWYNRGHNDQLGTDFVGCGMSCDPYEGDTSCAEALPILCLKKNGESNPGVTPYDEFYYAWSGGQITTTPPVIGTSLGSIENANSICETQFGLGWQMAEHHDGGGGWNWHATGHVRSDMRYWVYINDQPNGNCW